MSAERLLRFYLPARNAGQAQKMSTQENPSADSSNKAKYPWLFCPERDIAGLKCPARCKKTGKLCTLNKCTEMPAIVGLTLINSVNPGNGIRVNTK